ncbi:MAG: TIGR00730 family Rossman fold protein [Acidimicrobiales bacterium]|nr:TIGR00730 family Rossman fold protein [Acidimicrobiales bacterium]
MTPLPAPLPPSRGDKHRSKLEIFSSILQTVSQFGAENPDELDLKMVDTVLSEMTQAFRTFRPYRNRRKLTIFGSARTQPHEPLYIQAKLVAKAVSDDGWMVVTGAGPGIMAAGIEGAGAKNALGGNIRLPHEQQPNAFLASDPKLVEMRYFFTRKLMLIKESDAYVVLPGGFGTQDECLELLTLIQTGKAEPAPVILLDVKGDNYWSNWLDFVRDALSDRGYIANEDLSLVHLVDEPELALKVIKEFYSNYQSCRWVGERLVVRVKKVPEPHVLQSLSRRFSDMVLKDGIKRSDPLRAEILDNDSLDLERVVLYFDKRQYGRLHEFIWALNGDEEKSGSPYF